MQRYSSEGSVDVLSYEDDSLKREMNQQAGAKSQQIISRIEQHANSKQPVTGAEVYIKFEEQVKELDAELRKLGNKARALGRSAGILAASTRLRERLGRVLYLFRENAQTLFPEEIKEHIHVHHTPVKHIRRWKTKNFLDHTINIQTPLLDDSNSKHDTLAQEFWQFSKDVITLFECFGQYPEFLEELPDFSLAEDLQVWAKLLLENFEHEFATVAFQQFLFDSMVDIGSRLEMLARHFIQVFTTIGIPTVKASQDHGVSNLQNQTIVATLFAGIATGMIQVFSTGDTGGLHDWIVLLWYMTLIFSVASAVNGLLHLSWMQAIYRSPDSHVPWWVLIWLKRFPLVFLVLAVGCFFVALILFALTPQQNRQTLIVTIALSSCSCFGLVAVSSWFSCELIVYSVYGGRKWLADIIWKNSIVSFVKDRWKYLWEAGKNLPKDIEKARSHIRRIENGEIDTGSHVDLLAFTPLKYEDKPMTSAQIARIRWQTAIRRVLEAERRKSRRPTSTEQRPSRLGDLIVKAPMNMIRYQTMSKLQHMKIVLSHRSEDSRQAAMVRCLQFSPDGSHLVSTRWNSRSVIFNLKTHPLHFHSFEHPVKTGYVHQVDWSPDGNKLLMRSNRKLIIWQVAGKKENPHQTIYSNGSPGSYGESHQISQIAMVMEHETEASEHTMRSASWQSDSKGFLYSKGKRFLTMNNSKPIQLLPDNLLQHMELRSLCMSSDSLIIGAATIVQEDQKSFKQYCIIVFDPRKRFKVAKRIPVFYEISNLVLAKDKRSVLVSYVNKVCSRESLYRYPITSTRTDSLLLFDRHQVNSGNSTTLSEPLVQNSYYDTTTDPISTRLSQRFQVYLEGRKTISCSAPQQLVRYISGIANLLHWCIVSDHRLLSRKAESRLLHGTMVRRIICSLQACTTAQFTFGRPTKRNRSLRPSLLTQTATKLRHLGLFSDNTLS
ncbi:hypothetical protein BDY19DRAFT_926398 [Irpex rosettiformis]|uniref:Uncharacterized protein n=1 Tax=Irpex rosettiformis TaxID=378272 RepID=A0ACB8UEM1_9APHY|nr:hypothetical protein BDY19DRAFT_926398 [Irpex rosettiformis]